jgi:uncharacterized NAD(P)/FAD-binding protein YdhS
MRHQSGAMTIAIVGAGPSTLYILKHLLHQKQHTLNITIFEQGKSPGCGMPYSAEWTDKNHLANIASQEIPKLPNSFHIWLEDFYKTQPNIGAINHRKSKINAVPSRIILGKYFENQFDCICKELRKKGNYISLQTNHKVCDIRKISNENFLIEYLSVKGQRRVFQSNKVVIATGHIWPVDDANVGKYSIYRSPWPISKFDEVKGDRICIIGSSLSAIDVCLSIAHKKGLFVRDYNGLLIYKLKREHCNFALTMISRRGILPSQRFYFEYPRIKLHQYISKNKIRNMIRDNNNTLCLDHIFEVSFANILKHKSPELYELTKGKSLELFVKCIYDDLLREKPFDVFLKNYETYFYSEQHRIPISWKEILDDFAYTVSFYARYLSLKDRIRFSRTLMPLLSYVVAFVPHVSCEALIALHRAGCIFIEQGNYSDAYTISDNGIQIHLNNEGNTIGHQRTFDVVVDCRGQKAIEFDDFPFKGLVESGAVSPTLSNWKQDDQHSFNATDLQREIPGVSVNEYFNPIGVTGVPEPDVWITAVPLISGLYPYHSGLPFCNEVASIVAKELVRSKRRAA